MYIARLNLSCDPIQHIGDRMENLLEITDTALKMEISNIMGFAITDTWLDPDSGTLLCSYADDEQMLFQFAENNTFPLEVTISGKERLFLNL